MTLPIRRNWRPSATKFGKSNSEVPFDSTCSTSFTPRPAVEKANDFAPKHSRIFKEMIIVSSPSKPFMYTAKNTARRQAILRDYEAEIEALYNVVEDGTQADLSPPQSWDVEHTRDFVRRVVKKVLNMEVRDTDDLFRKGCDR